MTDPSPQLLTKGVRGLIVVNGAAESDATHRRLRVLEVMRDWLIRGGGGQDLLDHQDLALAWQGYLQTGQGERTTTLMRVLATASLCLLLIQVSHWSDSQRQCWLPHRNVHAS